MKHTEKIEKIKFYAYDDGKLKRLKRVSLYEKDKNGNDKIMEMIKAGNGLPKIYYEDKKGSDNY